MSPNRVPGPAVIDIGGFRCYPISDGDRLYPGLPVSVGAVLTRTGSASPENRRLRPNWR